QELSPGRLTDARYQLVRSKCFFIEENGAGKPVRALEVLIVIFIEFLDVHIQLLQQFLRLLAVKTRPGNRLRPPVAKYRAVAHIIFVSSRMTAKIVMILKDQNARFGS